MASEAQIEANRANAQKSTGPRTVEGKATVAQNAVKHGLRAEQMVIKGEDPGEFESYREQMLDELGPDGALESMLAERAVGLAWRLRRAERLQVEVFDTMLDADEKSPVEKLARRMHLQGASDDTSPLGRVVTYDFGHAQVLYRLGMYERRIEHSLYKTLNELRKHRLLREVDETAGAGAKAQNAGGGDTASEENHRQASLDAATPAETQARQTKPICPVSQLKTATTGNDPTRLRSETGGRNGEEEERNSCRTALGPKGGDRRPARVTAGDRYR